jgi:ComF family protein
VDHWIQSAKFNQDLAMARLLGQLLASASTPADSDQCPTLLPVPLHPRRLAQRGYNQALELSRPLLAQGYRLAPRNCRRRRHTSPQADLPAPARQQNVRGIFQVTGNLHGQRILLVDDVMTTGATLNELAATLKAAGAASVTAWVVARTTLHLTR